MQKTHQLTVPSNRLTIQPHIIHSHIVAQTDTHPCNNFSLERFAPDDKCQSDHVNGVVQSVDDNDPHVTKHDESPKQVQTCRDRNEHSETYTDFERRSKLPLSLKNTLRRRAIQSGNFRKKKDLQNISPLTKTIFSKLKKQQITCEICLGVVKQEDLVHLCKCDHMYCKNCIRDYVTFKIKMFQQVICPKEQCNKLMNQECEFYHNLAKEIKTQYIKIHNFYQTSKDHSLKLCPRQDCEGIIKLIENQPVRCPGCKREFCPKCFLQKHEGNCDQLEIDFLQNSLHFRQCQNCKFIVEKTQGCNHMTCRCKYEFCYVCGKIWTGYEHSCNQNQANMQQHDGLFEQNGFCGCLNCCEGSCGGTAAFIFQSPMRLFLSILFIGVVVIVASQSVLMVGFYLFAAITAGILGYSIEFICDLCAQERIGLAILFTILFPIAMCVGLYRAFTEMFVDLVTDQLLELVNLTRDGFVYLWT